MTPEEARSPCVYIIGAQCTGKTTLVNALEDSFHRNDLKQSTTKPLIIREVARTVLKEKQFSRDDITTSPSRALQLQKHILEAQFDAENAANAPEGPSSWYICDRSGLDPVVYAQLFVGEEAAGELLATETWKGLERRMKASIVILCEAGCSWLIDDGTRLMPEGMEQWMRIDTAFRSLLAVREIAYAVVPKDMIAIGERVELVKEQLRKHSLL
ncbi:hypothetical protein K458DRAFT_371268 [Lentithecium fluviatile CBS 122367]|uniref:NadR/Ttd14 AAA domain-containing protein n=1 Tax=Lentithecium fluviatile CBS 122367 TaxID=1168545 RepID=A0A6G1IUQ0_9PLEO|nr:hypothetical protein K458DRAFT_371268 [Lentithecium fluviatile CBS 122367]